MCRCSASESGVVPVGWAAFDVFDRGVRVDAEQADEVDAVGGMHGFMQDAVGPQLSGQDVDLVNGCSQPAVAGRGGGRSG
jgi:hypothetical protein